MQLRALLLISSLLLAACHTQHSPNLPRLFDGFMCVGSYTAPPTPRPPEFGHHSSEQSPKVPHLGVVYVYRKQNPRTFEYLAQHTLPDRLEAQGFTIEPIPGRRVSSFTVFDSGGAEFSTRFRKGDCRGVLFGVQMKPDDEEYYIRLDAN